MSTDLALRNNGEMVLGGRNIEDQDVLNEKLTVASKNSFKQMIKARSKGVENAIKSELTDDTSIIKQNLTRANKLNQPSYRIESDIDTLESKIREVVSSNLEAHTHIFQRELDLAVEDKDERLQQARADYEQVVKAIQEEYDSNIAQLQRRIRDEENKIGEEHCSELVAKLQEKRKEHTKVVKAERDINREVKTISAVAREYRQKILVMIQNASNEMLEALELASTKGDAINILNQMPVASKVVELLNTTDGIEEFVDLVAPNDAMLSKILNNYCNNDDDEENNEEEELLQYKDYIPAILIIESKHGRIVTNREY